jgi:oxygen-independent coproporphyrinogen-3 oxidase
MNRPALNVLSPKTLAAFVKPGPRYTSYPPATRFHGGFGAAEAEAELRALPAGEPISLYAHVAYCSSLCWYCGCNVVVTRKRDKGTEYVDLLIAELEMLGRAAGRRPIAELALGGGSPNFLRAADLRRLVEAVDATFDRTDDAVYGVELDPRDTTEETVAALADAGFHRVSVGIQDFSLEVQRRINRHQSAEQTANLIALTRERGFTSVNGDLVYGLPGQTPETFAATLDEVLAMRPDQIALFGYAHLPHRIKHQKLVERDGPVPGLDERTELLAIALDKFDAAGYRKIGLDHFALPDAPLAKAADSGDLHRNFQGYVVKTADRLLAIGATGISDTGTAYWQNLPLNDWIEAVSAGRLPVQRGVVLDADDRLRRWVITRLMCDGELSFAAAESRPEAADIGRFEDYFATELDKLREGNLSKLATVDEDARMIRTSDLGRHLIRNVSMVFDAGLRNDAATFSSTL